jgi:hypothetical protein
MTEPNAARGQADSAPKPTPGGDPPTANLAVVSRPSAVLDAAHLGDIEGAFGRIRVADTDVRRTVKTRLLTLLAIMGPGLIVMVGDNDAGGVATYAEAGQNYGYSLLWVLLLLIPVLIVNQEMVVRLGAVTGVGHARLINERFGRGWGWFSVGDLFLLNFLTIVTEFIGISLAANYFGLSKYVVVPTAAVALIAIMASGSFRRWERAMFVFVAIVLLQIPMLLLSHPQWGAAARGFVVPGMKGGLRGFGIGYGSIILAVPEVMACRSSAADTFSVPVAERRKGSNSRQPSSRAIALPAARRPASSSGWLCSAYSTSFAAVGNLCWSCPTG